MLGAEIFRIAFFLRRQIVTRLKYDVITLLSTSEAAAAAAQKVYSNVCMLSFWTTLVFTVQCSFRTVSAALILAGRHEKSEPNKNTHCAFGANILFFTQRHHSYLYYCADNWQLLFDFIFGWYFGFAFVHRVFSIQIIQSFSLFFSFLFFFFVLSRSYLH